MSSIPTETIEDRRKFPQRWADELHEKQNFDVINDYFAPDWVGHIDGKELTRTEYKEMHQELNSGFPDLEVTFGPVIVEEDTVGGHWVMTGTHTGEFLGLKPTGRPVHVTGTFLTRYGEEGSAIETWENIDQFSMLQQLGIAPEDFTVGGLTRTLVNLVKSGI